MQPGAVILKLGGSVSTDKRSGKPILKTRHLRRLAREVARAREPHSPLILLCGAGSFGHPLAHRYRLSGRELSVDALSGAGKTISAVRKLGTALADIFLDEGVPVVPLQTSSFVRQEKGKLIVTNYSLIEDILAHGGVPLFGGDVIVDDHHRTVIASADALASELVKHFHSRRLLFATDVNGVYEKFPAQAHEQPLSIITRKELQAIVASSQPLKGNAHDVTGTMMGKLRSLLPLRNCTITIFNGLLPNTLAKVLRGEKEGTSVVL